MEAADKGIITVETTVHVPVEQAWEYWTEPKHITQWAFASDEWHAPRAENDLSVGGKFLTRMEAKDGSFGFDLIGVYDEIRTHAWMAYTLEDGRKVTVSFIGQGDETRIVEAFEAEATNPPEMQKAGWQAILDNYKKYSERSK